MTLNDVITPVQIDTGADMTIITKSYAKDLGLDGYIETTNRGYLSSCGTSVSFVGVIPLA